MLRGTRGRKHHFSFGPTLFPGFLHSAGGQSEGRVHDVPHARLCRGCGHTNNGVKPREETGQ